MSSNAELVEAYRLVGDRRSDRAHEDFCRLRREIGEREALRRVLHERFTRGRRFEQREQATQRDRGLADAFAAGWRLGAEARIERDDEADG